MLVDRRQARCTGSTAGAIHTSINGRGHISVQPQGDRGGSLDPDLVSELKSETCSAVADSLDDILEDRLERLHAAFERAIAQYSYPGRYQVSSR